MGRNWFVRVAAFIGCVVLNLLGEHPRAIADDAARPFAKFVDEYFAERFAWNPPEGTAAGFHQYDSQMGDRSAEAFLKQIAKSKELLERLGKLRDLNLTRDETIDAEILDHQLRAELLELDVIRDWRTDPMGYLSAPGDAIDGLIKRNFAPPAERLRSVIARLKAVPPLYVAMRANTENPPREFTDLGINIAEGSIEFFSDTATQWAKEAAGKDAALLDEFNAANRDVLAALNQTVDWMKQDLVPRSKGSFALGADNFSKTLLYENMVDTPLDKLLAVGQAALKKDHDAFAIVASKIDAKSTPAEVMARLTQDHPTEDDLIPSAKRTLEKTRQFAIDHHIVKIASEVRPIVEETPPFQRVGVFAAMDTPGAYEQKAKEAFYYVTPVEKEWTHEHKEEHLRLFNAPVMQIVTIHEAFPGHFIQFMYSPNYPTKTRKLAGCSSNAEGWAHYCEQMMVEQGYGDGDPKIQLAQLSEALLCDCRFIVAIKMHTQGMTVDEATKHFETEGYQPHAVAADEARRGTFDPMYLVYTLGKLQIYKLRDDYRKLKGRDFNLEAFHNDFVTQGCIPIKLVRQIMLPGDTGSAL